VNIVLDIETIPRDLAREPRKIQEYVWERALRRGADAPPELTLDDYLADPGRQACRAARERVELFMGLRPEFGHVICIGLGQDVRGRAELEVRGLTAESESDERRLLEAFWALHGELVRGRRDWRLVTYNGLAFDVPFLLRRSLYLGVAPTAGLPMRPFAPDAHFDVMRVLSNWERADAVRMDVVAELLGLAKVPPGMDGSQVLALWRQGRRAEIETYCLGDVRLVYEIFLRMESYFR
jgi:hypothetical protein